MEPAVNKTAEPSETPVILPSSGSDVTTSGEGVVNVNKLHVVGPSTTSTSESQLSTEDESVVYLNEQQCGQLMRLLKSQREGGKFCDVRLTVQDTDYWAHKCVLAASSAYFHSLLTKPDAKSTTMIGDEDLVLDPIIIETKNKKAFESLMDYMYTGQLAVGMTFVDELLRLCQMLGIVDIKQCCGMHLDKNLDIDNWHTIYSIAQNYKLDDSLNSVERFIIENFFLLAQGRDLSSVDHVVVRRVLEACCKQEGLEMQCSVVFAIFKWVIFDYTERIHLFPHLVQLVNIEYLTSDALKGVFDSVATLHQEILDHPVTQALLKDVESHQERQRQTELEAELERKRQEEQEKEEKERQLLAEKEKNEEEAKMIQEVEAEMNIKVIKTELAEDADRDSLYDEVDEQFTEIRANNFPKIEQGLSDDDDDGMESDNTDIYEVSMETDNKQTSEFGTQHDEDNKENKSEDQYTVEIKQDFDPLDTEEVPSPATGNRKRRRKAAQPTKISKTNCKIYKQTKKPPSVKKRGRPKAKTIIIKEVKKKMKTLGTQTADKEDELLDDFGVGSDFPNYNEVMPDVDEDDDDEEEGEGDGGQNEGDDWMPGGREAEAEGTESSPPSKKTSIVKIQRDGIKKKKRHRKSKLDGETFACLKCPRVFDTPSGLSHHMKGHGSDTPFLCDICGFTTIHFASINVHKRQHNGMKFKCTYPGCNYSSIRRSRLDDHQNNHMGIKNYVCQICGKAFAGRKHMQRHEKIHVEIKPLHCDECDYGTTRRDKLKDHIRKHHPNTAISMGYMTIEDLNKPKVPEKPRIRKRNRKKNLFSSMLKAEKIDVVIDVSHEQRAGHGSGINVIASDGGGLAAVAGAAGGGHAPGTIPPHMVGQSTISEEMIQYLATMASHEIQQQYQQQGPGVQGGVVSGGPQVQLGLPPQVVHSHSSPVHVAAAPPPSQHTVTMVTQPPQGPVSHHIPNADLPLQLTSVPIPLASPLRDPSGPHPQSNPSSEACLPPNPPPAHGQSMPIVPPGGVIHAPSAHDQNMWVYYIPASGATGPYLQASTPQQ